MAAVTAGLVNDSYPIHIVVAYTIEAGIFPITMLLRSGEIGC